MSIFKLIKFELKKQFSRKDLLILFSMLLIPLLYSIGINQGSSNITYEGSGQVDALQFSQEMYVFIYMIFIFFLIAAVGAINSLRGEIDNGSISVLLQKVNNRSKIYFGKFFSQSIFFSITTIIFMLFSIACFFIFLGGTDIAVNRLFTAGKFLNQLIIIGSILLTFILAISIAQFLSMYFKLFTSMGLFLIIWVAFIYLKEFESVKFISPLYHLENLIDSSGSLIRPFMNLIIVYIIYIAGTLIWGNLKFKRSDLD